MEILIALRESIGVKMLSIKDIVNKLIRNNFFFFIFMQNDVAYVFYTMMTMLETIINSLFKLGFSEMIVNMDNTTSDLIRIIHLGFPIMTRNVC